jgi:hypothetical protein
LLPQFIPPLVGYLPVLAQVRTNAPAQVVSVVGVQSPQ